MLYINKGKYNKINVKQCYIFPALTDETCPRRDNICHQPYTSTLNSAAENQAGNFLYDNNHNNEESTQCIRDIKGKLIFM